MAETASSHHISVEPYHVAASILGGELPRSPSPELQRAETVRQRLGGKKMFEAVAESESAEPEPNFADIAKAATSRIKEADKVQKRINDLSNSSASSAQAERTLLEKEKDSITERAKRLEQTKKLLEELYNVTSSSQISDELVKEVARILANTPGFCIGVAKELGYRDPGRLKTLLESFGFAKDSRIWRIIERHIRDERMRKRLIKAMSGVTYDETIDTLDGQIEDLEERIGQTRQKLTAERTWCEEVEEAYNNLDQQALIKLAQVVPTLRNKKSYLESVLSSLNINWHNLDDKNQLESLATFLRGRKNPPSNQLQNNYAIALQLVSEILDIYDKDPNLFLPSPNNLHQKSPYQVYIEYTALQQKRAEIAAAETQMRKDELDLANLRQQRRRLLESYEGKVLRVLESTVKGYYNEVILGDAYAIAQAEAQEKEGEKEKAETREQKLKLLLDRFLSLSLFRYEGGRVVGWDDQFLKEAVKVELLQRSPEKMLEYIVQRVIEQRTQMPENYQKQINSLLVELGIGSLDKDGNFILPQNKTISQLVSDFFSQLNPNFVFQEATIRVPKLLGAAYARGYWSDRLRFSKTQVAFLKSAYTPEFFAKALEGKKEYQNLVDAELGKGVLDLGSELTPQLKRVFGKNWLEGLWKLMKILGLISAFGLGIFLVKGSAGAVASRL
jgi:hypothetical protein